MRLSSFFQILCVTALLLMISDCSTVPITGRTQLNMMTEQELITAADTNFNQFMGLVNNKNAVLSPSDSPEAAAEIETVNRVGERIIEAAGLRGSRNWQIVVVNSSNANAFVLPNGKIVVYTGIFPIAETEGGLAAIIGHEVAHVLAHHQAERLSQVLLTELALSVADAALAMSESKSQYRPAVSAALGLGAQYGILLPYSRKHESEADHIGLFLMAKAGYDPSEAIGVWERMGKAGGSGPWEFLSTHPSDQTRQTNIREWVPEANVYYADQARPLPSNLAEVKSIQAEQSKKMAFAPVASQPSIQPGFWYRYTGPGRIKPTTYRVDRRDRCSAGECFFMSADDGGRRVYTTAGGLVEIRKPDGSWTHASPAIRLLRFPLRVGDSWTDTVILVTSSGARIRAKAKASVVGYESITVPARSFMAYKVNVSLDGILFLQVWYAPEARIFVRTIGYDESKKEEIAELIDYQITEEPAGPMNPQSPERAPAPPPPPKASHTVPAALPAPQETVAELCKQGDLLVNRQQYDSALLLYEKAVALDPADATPYFGRAVIYMAKHELEQSFRDFDKAVELRPGWAEGYAFRCAVLYALGSHPMALADCEKAIALNPRLAIAYEYRGGVYFEYHDNKADALRDFNKAIELDPRLGIAYASRGAIQERLGHTEEAIRDYKVAAKLGVKAAQDILVKRHITW